MNTLPLGHVRLCVASTLLLAGLLGCSKESEQPQKTQAPAPSAETPTGEKTEGKLVLYCGRSTSLVGPILERFTAATGIQVELKEGKTPELAALIKTEGKASPADVFWAQDPGALGDLTDANRFAKLSDSVLSLLPGKFAGPDGRWVATSGRARVLAYSPKRVEKSALPQSIFDLTDPRWKGRIGWAPTNGSFLAFLTAMRQVHGEEKTKKWVEQMKANEPKAYPKNTPIIEAIAAGDIDVGLPNHYYLLRYKKSEGADYPVEQTFFQAGDIGNMIMVAGAGVIDTAPHPKAAERFIAFLLSRESQSYFTNEVFEYPVSKDVEQHEFLMKQADFVERVPEVDVRHMSDLEGTKKLLQEAGLF